MSERRLENAAPGPWRVPVAVEDIPEAGQHFTLAAESDVRAAIARIAGLRDLSRLEADFDVMRHGAAGLHVVGRISASVGQTCVVTLEPLVNDVTEDVDLLFMPQSYGAEIADETNRDEIPRDMKWDELEPLIGGVVDLGALATEFLLLGLHPYPRKPGAVFEPPRDPKPDASPFAALAGLTAKARDDA